MNDENGRNRRRKPPRDASEIGAIRVFSKPGPDAEDRLRRLMSLMVKHATRNGREASDDDSTSDPPHADGTGSDGIENEDKGSRGDRPHWID